MLQRALWAVSLIGAIAIAAVPSSPGLATPAPVLGPHLPDISKGLPPGHTMRLPSRIILGGPADDDFINELIVKVLPANTPPSMTVGLFTCRTAAYPCLVGSFSAESPQSISAQREFRKHQAANQPITLAANVRGFLLEGPTQTPSHSFSSVMWQQDGMLYTISFLAAERQNILTMAYLMANNRPIQRTHLTAQQ